MPNNKFLPSKNLKGDLVSRNEKDAEETAVASPHRFNEIYQSKNLLTDKQLEKLIVAKDAREVIKKMMQIDPKFNSFVSSFFTDFNDGKLNRKAVDKYGTIALQAGVELKKISKRVINIEPRAQGNLILNGIVLIYGYGALFNQAIDDGIIEDHLNRQIKVYSKIKGISESAVLSALDNVGYSSFLIKRYFRAKEVAQDAEVMNKASKLLDMNRLFDDFRMREVAAKLERVFSESDLQRSEKFGEYLKLFRSNYFPLLAAVRLLKQTQEYSTPASRPKVYSASLEGFDELKDTYLQLKRWKDISGIEANANQLRLYFEVFFKFAEANGIKLYSPIKKFIKEVSARTAQYSAVYNLEDLSGAKMERVAWDSILD